MAQEQQQLGTRIKFSPLWPVFEFAEILLKVSYGTYPHSNLANSDITDFPLSIISADIITVVYGEAFESPEDALKLFKITILASKNNQTITVGKMGYWN